MQTIEYDSCNHHNVNKIHCEDEEIQNLSSNCLANISLQNIDSEGTHGNVNCKHEECGSKIGKSIHEAQIENLDI